MQYFGGVCKFQVGTSPPFAPNSWKVKTEPGASVHNVMFLIQSWTIFIVIRIGYTYMPIFTLVWVAGVSWGLAKSGPIALKMLHILSKGRVQSGYSKTADISQVGVCIQTMHLTPPVVLQQPLEPQNWPEWTTTYQVTIHWIPVMTPLSMNLNRVISGFTLQPRNGLYMEVDR
jgi:hypothetical protein